MSKWAKKWKNSAINNFAWLPPRLKNQHILKKKFFTPPLTPLWLLHSKKVQNTLILSLVQTPKNCTLFRFLTYRISMYWWLTISNVTRKCTMCRSMSKWIVNNTKYWRKKTWILFFLIFNFDQYSLIHDSAPIFWYFKGNHNHINFVVKQTNQKSTLNIY